jgi:predicted ferric reductase
VEVPNRRQAIRRAAAAGPAAVAAAGAVAIVAMWLADGGVAESGRGEWLLAIGRLTGLEGTYAAVLTVLFLSREPWLDRVLGMESLVRWHRWVGQSALMLLLAHTAFTIWGYGAQAHAGILHETKVVVLDLPDMLAATIGLGLLVVVGVVSVRAVRRRVRYQTWYFIHLYTYLALALSFAHQFATGVDFATHPVNRWIWGAMYVAVLALVVTHHVVLPVGRAIRWRLHVDRVVAESARAVSVYIRGTGVPRLRAMGGQFVFVRFLSRDRWWEAHPFSLSAVPDDDCLRITVTSVGDFTCGVRSLRPGTRVLLEGPFGRFTRRLRANDKVLLIAAGAGIAPIRAILDDLDARPGDVTLLYRAHDEATIALRDELDAIAGRTGAQVRYLPGPREDHDDLLDPAALAELVGGDLTGHDVFVCGPYEFTARIGKTLVAAGVDRRSIHTERFEI